MKRLVWLLLLVLGTALVQVSAVDLGHQQEKACSCCEKPGSCGNRDCGLPPTAPTSSSVLAEQPQTSVSTASRKRTACLHRLAINYLFPSAWRSPRQNFFACEPAALARVPLFKSQCSFLI